MNADLKIMMDQYTKLVNENNRLRYDYQKLKESSSLLDTLLKKIENVHDMRLITNHIKNTIIEYTGTTHASIFVKTNKHGLSLTSTTISRVQSRTMNDNIFLNIISNITDMIVVDTEKEEFLSQRRLELKTSLIIPCISRHKDVIGYLLLESDIENYFDNLKEISFDTLSKIVTMIVEIILTYDALKEKMYTDPMVNAYTREYMNVLIKESLLERGSIKTNFIMTMFDIDKFKHVNDTYGHIVGDQVIKNVVNYLKTKIRSDDYLIRIGGDEFLILHMNTSSGDVIFNKLADIRDEISKIPMLSDKNEEFNITCSFGILNPQLLSPPFIFDDLYRLVDNMLYKSKESGRNKVSYFKSANITKNLPEDNGEIEIQFDQK